MKLCIAKGRTVEVSPEDYDELRRYSWFLCNGYPARSVWTPKRVVVYMHRQITNAPKGMEVDHINRNKLDNRRENLRIVTRKTNSYNLPVCKRNTSGVRGVSWHKTRGKWRAHIYKDYKQIHLGVFTTFEDAIAARQRAEKEHWNAND